MSWCARSIIEAALCERGGWVFGTIWRVRKLGIPRSTLESKIRSLKIRLAHGELRWPQLAMIPSTDTCYTFKSFAISVAHGTPLTRAARTLPVNTRLAWPKCSLGNTRVFRLNPPYIDCTGFAAAFSVSLRRLAFEALGVAKRPVMN